MSLTAWLDIFSAQLLTLVCPARRTPRQLGILNFSGMDFNMLKVSAYRTLLVRYFHIVHQDCMYNKFYQLLWLVLLHRGALRIYCYGYNIIQLRPDVVDSGTYAKTLWKMPHQYINAWKMHKLTTILIVQTLVLSYGTHQWFLPSK